MSSGSSSSSSGIGFFGLLGVAFIVLKLTGFIDWPWIWVVSPLWIPLAIFIAILVVGGGGYLAYKAIKQRRKKRAP